jgi:hypothetical protein
MHPRYAHDERLTIMDALFNLREIAKQLLMVEDHLNHPHKLCPDCLRKHLMTVEALAEEAVSLDGGRLHARGCEKLAEQARHWIMQIADGRDPLEMAQEIRKCRKALMPLVHDPRGVSVRVASAYIERSRCPHV